MIKTKKGAELALNVVIIAAIALLVLAVLIFIFSSRASKFTQGVGDCEFQGGTCSETRCLLQAKPEISNTNCADKDPTKPYCCSESFAKTT